jgi:hypothetical protein
MKTTKTKYIDVVSAKYLADYKVRIVFNDGASNVVDFEPFLRRARHPDITKYRASKLFKTFKVSDGNLMWGDFEMIFPVWDLYRGKIETGSTDDEK